MHPWCQSTIRCEGVGEALRKRPRARWIRNRDVHCGTAHRHHAVVAVVHLRSRCMRGVGYSQLEIWAFHLFDYQTSQTNTIGVDQKIKGCQPHIGGILQSENEPGRSRPRDKLDTTGIFSCLKKI